MASFAAHSASLFFSKKDMWVRFNLCVQWVARYLCLLHACIFTQIPAEWLESVTAVFHRCALNAHLEDPELKDFLCMQLDHVLSSIKGALLLVDGLTAYAHDTETPRKLLTRTQMHHRSLISSTSTCSVVSHASLPLCHKCHSGNPA